MRVVAIVPSIPTADACVTGYAAGYGPLIESKDYLAIPPGSPIHSGTTRHKHRLSTEPVVCEVPTAGTSTLDSQVGGFTAYEHEFRASRLCFQ
jgi:hypothetical protein